MVLSEQPYTDPSRGGQVQSVAILVEMCPGAITKGFASIPEFMDGSGREAG